MSGGGCEILTRTWSEELGAKKAARGWARGLVLAAAAAVSLHAGAAAAEGSGDDWRGSFLSSAGADAPEVRIGGFAHSVAGAEYGSADVNFELQGPRLPFPVPDRFKVLVPLPDIGAMINTAGKTSYAYLGVVWRLNLLPRTFIEPAFGGAIHNGNASSIPQPGQVTLGCRTLFHTGISGGYRLSDRWTVLGTWDHISNADTCFHNIGMNGYGVKLGYSF